MTTPVIPLQLWMIWHSEAGGWLCADDDTHGDDGPFLVTFSEEEADATIDAQRELYDLDDLVAVRVK